MPKASTHSDHLAEEVCRFAPPSAKSYTSKSPIHPLESGGGFVSGEVVLLAQFTR